MNFKFKKVVYSFFGFLVVLSIADRIDEYFLRKKLKKMYSLGTKHSEFKCFDMKVRDGLNHIINIEGGFGTFCIRKKYLDTLIPVDIDEYYQEIVYDYDNIYLPMKKDWVEKTFYVENLVTKEGYVRFPIGVSDPKNRMYLKQEYR